MTAPASISTQDLRNWMDRALSDEAEAHELARYVNELPGVIEARPLDERWQLEIAWIGVWRRPTGQLRFRQEF